MATIPHEGGPLIGVTDVDSTTSDIRLKKNALTLWDSTAMAVTSTAPTYSMASTMFLIAGAVGLVAPATIMVSFIFVLGIAIAYSYFNRTNPNCGASYSWLTQAISPFLGWFTGWIQLVASILFIITAPVLAGSNTLTFLASFGWVPASASGNTWAVALVGLVWLVVVTAMVAYGIRITAHFQTAMLIVEYVALLLFSTLAFVKVATVHPSGSAPVSWHWFNPLGFHSIGQFAAGAVLAVFFYWGWDTAANVNEETSNARVNPGRAGIIGMFLLLVVFLIAATAMQSLLPQQTIHDQGANALQYFAGAVLPAPWSYLMLLALLSSTIAVLQTTLLPATRLSFAMSRDRVWPRVFSIIHPRWQTPAIGTLILAAICIVGLLLTTVSPNVNATLTSMSSNIGVLVSFYYGITGFACIWYFRRVLTRSAATFFFAGVLPLVSGAFLFWIGVEVVLQGQQQSGWGYVLPVLICFVVGVPLTAVAWLANRPYFAYRPVAYDPDDASSVAALAEAHAR
jgi:amino acid transporter